MAPNPVGILDPRHPDGGSRVHAGVAWAGLWSMDHLVSDFLLGSMHEIRRVAATGFVVEDGGVGDTFRAGHGPRVALAVLGTQTL